MKLTNDQEHKMRESSLDARKGRPYVRNGKRQMSERLRRAILQLEKEMKDNEPIVKRLFKEAGVDPDPIVVSSALKYHKTLEKLAKE